MFLQLHDIKIKCCFRSYPLISTYKVFVNTKYYINIYTWSGPSLFTLTTMCFITCLNSPVTVDTRSTSDYSPTSTTNHSHSTTTGSTSAASSTGTLSCYWRNTQMNLHRLALKVPITPAADGIHKDVFIFFFREKKA